MANAIIARARLKKDSACVYDKLAAKSLPSKTTRGKACLKLNSLHAVLRRKHTHVHLPIGTSSRKQQESDKVCKRNAWTLFSVLMWLKSHISSLFIRPCFWCGNGLGSASDVSRFPDRARIPRTHFKRSKPLRIFRDEPNNPAIWYPRCSVCCR